MGLPEIPQTLSVELAKRLPLAWSPLRYPADHRQSRRALVVRNRIGIKIGSGTRLKLYRRFYQKQKEIGPTLSDQLASLASVVTLLTIDNLEERRF